MSLIKDRCPPAVALVVKVHSLAVTESRDFFSGKEQTRIFKELGTALCLRRYVRVELDGETWIGLVSLIQHQPRGGGREGQ